MVQHASVMTLNVEGESEMPFAQGGGCAPVKVASVGLNPTLVCHISARQLMPASVLLMLTVLILEIAL